MITVIDYGMGNLRNVRRAFREIGHEAMITHEPHAVESASKIVLPGVGAFGEAVRRIDQLGLRTVILDYARRGHPLLGICLGMQLLFEESDESPEARGLGLLAGRVRRFSGSVKTPHVGWNEVRPEGESVYFPDPAARPCFYFVHSFRIPPIPETIGLTDYDGMFSAAVQKGAVTGFQFHPEKSQDAGLELLRKFAAL